MATLQIKLKTISPVHIASGSFLMENRDFYVEGNSVRRLHYPSLLAKIPEEDLEKSLQTIKNDGLAALIPKPAKKEKKEKKPQILEDWKQTLRALEDIPQTAKNGQAPKTSHGDAVADRPPNALEDAQLYQWHALFGNEEIGDKIHEMMLDTYLHTFFPGTTLKGVIRSALYIGALSREPQRLNRLRFTWTANPLEADYPLEREMTGREMHSRQPDIFQKLMVRDSNCQPALDSLGIFQLKILNIAFQEEGTVGVMWKKGSQGNVASAQEAESFYWEMVQPGREFASAIAVDATSEPNAAAFVLSPENIMRSLHDFGRNIVEQELQFAREYQIVPLQNFYGELKERCEKTANGGKIAYIPVGSGVPWHGKTIGALLDSSSLDTIRRHFYRYLGKFIHQPCQSSFHGMRLRRGQCPKCNKPIRPEKLACIEPFPKTRHILFDDGQPALPPGWISVELG